VVYVEADVHRKLCLIDSDAATGELELIESVAFCLFDPGG